MNKILILDDIKEMAERYRNILVKENYDVKISHNSTEFLKIYKDFQPDLIILDVELNGSQMNGIEVFKYLLKTKELNSKVIIISGEASRTQVSVAMKLGAYTFVEKTGHFNTKKFLADVRQAINLKQQEEQNKRLKDDNINLRKELEPRKVFIGECPAILEVKEQIKRYAKKDISVLIYGETGTGKEVVANNLYWESERNGKPFEIVHIGGLNENLIDSELFGHKKGAFTGADYDKIGKFEKADQGIVFLDEISDFDLNIQAKLKRAIENKEIQMIGGNTKKIDVKFIFATNQNLLEKIRNNEFREDLYERMDVAKIELPPLRERGNDIILLMKHFFSILSQKHDRYDNSDLKSLKKPLLNYRWERNIRQLMNFCEKVFLNNEIIDNEIIINEFNSYVSQQHGKQNDTFYHLLNIENYKDAKTFFKKKYITYHYHKNKRHTRITAEKLGMDHSGLSRYIKKERI